jgi:hypothetical protein
MVPTKLSDWFVTALLAIALLAVMLCVPMLTSAQSISPLVSEYHKKASGAFLVRNDSMMPTTVTIEAASYKIDDGKQNLRSLDESVHLELSEQTFRLSAQETHAVTYKASCMPMPCGFAIFATFVQEHQIANGVKVAIHLPTAVYICADTKKACRQRVRAMLTQ